MPITTATRWMDCVPNSSSASSEIIIWAEKRDYLTLQPAFPHLPSITTTALPALGRAASDSRGQPPYKENKAGDGTRAGPREKAPGDGICVCAALCTVVLSPLYISEQASHSPPLLTLCCDHIAALRDKKAFSSVTELSYYFKCYLNTTTKYSCESIPDCRS